MEIVRKLEAALQETIDLLDRLPQDEINKVPSPGSWTAAQTAQHLLLAEQGMDSVLSAPAPAANRNPEERATEFETIFMDFERKMDSPAFIMPEDKDYDKLELIRTLGRLKDPLVKAAGENNLAQVPDLGDEHPLNGATKLELLHFVTYHTLRHNHQIRKIAAQLAYMSPPIPGN